MKVGLITIVNGASFGNRLQNYATQVLFEKLGYEVETINNRAEKNSTIKTYIQFILANYFGWLPVIKRKKLNWKRMYTFFQWDRCHIKYTKKAVNSEGDEKSWKRLAQTYQYFVVGSDQVWNPKYSGNQGFELLSFAEPEKRVSLSTSIGCGRIPDAYLDMYRREWQKFKAISVREDEAAELVRTVSGRGAEVHIDPTMMLSREEWSRIQKKPDFFSEGEYLLLFFLTRPDEKTSDIISRFAQKKGLRQLSLNADLPGYENVSPDEFIYYISHARMVCTDSFHAGVFTLLFGRALAALRRFDEDQDVSRLHTLLRRSAQLPFWADRLQDVSDLEMRYGYLDYDLSWLEEERRSVREYIKRVCC